MPETFTIPKPDIISLRDSIPTLREIDRQVLKGELLYFAKDDAVIWLTSDDFEEYRRGGDAYQAVANKFSAITAPDQRSNDFNYLGVDIPENFYGIIEIETTYGEKVNVIMFRDEMGLYIKPILKSENHTIHLQMKQWGFKETSVRPRGTGVLYFVGKEQQARWEIMLANHKIGQIRELVKLGLPAQPHKAHIKKIHQHHRNGNVKV